MKQAFLSLFAALALTACAPPIENDPIYQQLKANPPTLVPERHVRVLGTGKFTSCDVFNEGDPQRQYMTCWHSGNGNALTRFGSAILHYYPPYPPKPPHPSQAKETYLGHQVSNVIQLYK